MNIDEIKRQKAELENRIAVELRAFEQNTGCTAHSVDVVHRTVMGPAYGQVEVVAVEVHVP